MDLVKVVGRKNSHKVLVYALSTCVHCKATMQFLRESDVEFEYLYVDLCDKKDLEEVKKDILGRRGSFSFPKIIIDNKIMITGFDKERIKKSLDG